MASPDTKPNTPPSPSQTIQPSHRPPSDQHSSPPSTIDTFFAHPTAIYMAASLLRLGMLLYGLWQDANSPVKYTDIDYLVFTDAARFVSRPDEGDGGGSPYDRETYRYTPLLAWMLLPTAWGAGGGGGSSSWWWFSSGKVLFAAADVLAGWFLVRILEGDGNAAAMGGPRARRFAAVWLLNPMVAAISTRGSSEGLLGALVAALLWAALRGRVVLAGLLLGCGVHLKIYPFVYAPAVLWWMGRGGKAGPVGAVGDALIPRVLQAVTPERVKLTVVSLVTFMGLNVLMFALYGKPFIQHTYMHHVTRIDHRHNFSPYNTLLYLTSASPLASSTSSPSATSFSPPWLRIESLAFLPQLLLSTLLIPVALAKRDLPTTMLAQTFAFVTFNKVCTSQYFIWYMVLLPLYLPRSSFVRDGRLGLVALALWVAVQAAWLQQGFKLEFLGRSTFLPGLWVSSLLFFLVNCWILGVVISDAGKAVEPAHSR